MVNDLKFVYIKFMFTIIPYVLSLENKEQINGNFKLKYDRTEL